ADLVVWIFRVRMKRIEIPAPVTVAHRLEPVEGGTHPAVVPVSEGGEHVDPDEEIVVVVDRIVEPEPWTIRGGPLAKQVSIQVELRAPFDRAVDFRAPGGRGQRRKGGERLPAVEGPGR